MTKHTPGNLTVEHGEITNIYWVEDASGESVCDLYHRINDGHDENSFYRKPNAAANAARIVHIWNCHDELVEALEWALAEITAKTKYTTENQFGDCLAKATAQLSKAKGE